MYTFILFDIFTIDVKFDNITSIVGSVAVILRISLIKEMGWALHCSKENELFLCLQIFLTQNPRK